MLGLGIGFFMVSGSLLPQIDARMCKQGSASTLSVADFLSEFDIHSPTILYRFSDVAFPHYPIWALMLAIWRGIEIDYTVDLFLVRSWASP